MNVALVGNAAAPDENANIDDANFGEAVPFNYPDDDEGLNDDNILFPDVDSFKDFVGRYFIYNVNDQDILHHIFFTIAGHYINRDLTLAQREEMLRDLQAVGCTINNDNRNEFLAAFNVPVDTVRLLMQEGARRRKSRRNKSRRNNRKMRKTRRH